jgi:hypothetical protein
MKQFLFAVSVGLVAIGLVTQAKAPIYSGDMGGAKNCGFVTFEQCMENVRGIGGFCQRNDWYRPPPGATGRVPARTHY